MRILKVIHGYPERYNAGSEVYTQTLCHGLVHRGHQVVVFARCEDAYRPEYSVHEETDSLCPDIKLHLINMAHSRDGYRNSEVDKAFTKLVRNFKPDVIHIGHLSHLSTSIIEEARKAHLPIVVTLHDFWFMCPRGQFLQTTHSKKDNLYPVCDSQDDQKCAKTCYWRHFGQEEDEEDLAHWTSWIKKRMTHVKEMCSYVDLFVAPSQYLLQRFTNEFVIHPSKIIYLDYGFDLNRLS